MGAKVFFLVPTRLLVEQQVKAVREWTGMRVEEYMGDDRKLPDLFDVLVSTPEAFEIAQANMLLVPWDGNPSDWWFSTRFIIC